MKACKPPDRLPDDSRGKRFADRILPRGLWMCLFFAAVAVAVFGAPHLPARPGLALEATATLAAGSYCLLNFWRCREAHCILSGSGWSALALFEFVELGLGRSLIDRAEGLVFLVILAVAYGFEAWWRASHGTKVLSTETRRG